ncbi:zinc ABC transporter substrate-binding protein [Bradyrhizobium sp. CW9]|uniref:metal ABC transporter solute-binding protein, Zn/Mn family n=1 Tax=Bradyrhizobium sp. CW9 TaxID=2782689 RepID=UPI001FFB12B9|nr:zinc ABC transporter substrate-binding protein [Bradyrhizobium sp. CW9]MCK1332603.1 zinc ABC transporter substrate-binding protein [Bradyrhizobium sp. CW9]
MKSDLSIRARFRVVLASVSILLGASTAGAEDRIKVVATFSVIGDMVANVAGDKVDLVTLVGPAGDTERFKPSLADGKNVAEAKIVFMNDLNDQFEPWLEPLLKQVKFSGAKIIVSRGAKTHTSTEERGPRTKFREEEIDQHAWLDPKNGVIYVRNIAAALAKSDPANAADYRARADAYIKELQALDAWAKAEIAALPAAKRRVLASHDSLQYLAKAYGITLLSINGWTNNSEPSAAELARLTRQIQQEGIHALFLDSITDPRAMQQVAKETGASIGGTLYGDALSKPGEEADTYLKMLRHDVTALKAGMMKN